MVIYNLLLIALAMCWIVCGVGNMWYTYQLGKTVKRIHKMLVQDSKSDKHIRKEQKQKVLKQDKNWGEH